VRYVLIIVCCLGPGLLAPLSAGALELVPAATLYDGNRVDVCFGNERVYVASATGLEIFDISDPTNPVRSGQVIRTEGALFVARIGDRLALATGSDSLIIYELINRDTPVQIGAFASHGRIRVLQSYGDHVYFADRVGWKRVRVLPVASPVLDYVQTEHALIGALGFTGDSMYVVRSDGLSLVYRINPLPRLIDLYWSRTDIESFAITDGYAYAAARDSGIFVYELDPAVGAREVGRFYTYGTIHQLMGDGGLLYMADRQRGLLILDLADPKHPFLIGGNDEPIILRTVKTSGAYAAGAAADGLYIYDISNPYLPRTLGHTGDQNVVRDVVLDQDILFAAVDKAGLSVIDITEPEQPAILNETILTNQILGVDRTGGLLALACGSTGLILADINEPAMPVEVYRARTSGLALDVAAADSLAVVADGSRGFKIFRISNPLDYRLLGGKKTQYPVGAVARRDNYVYAAGRDLGLEVYNISNPFKPKLTYRHRPAERVSPLILHERRAYLGVDTIGVVVFDISSPAYPVIIDTVNVTRYPRGIIADGALLYVIDPLYGLMLIDYRVRGAAEVISTTPLAASANDFALGGDALYVAGNPYLYTFHVSPPATPGDLDEDGAVSIVDIVYFVNYLYRCGPIPLRGVSADLNGDGRLGLVDLARLIRMVFP